MKYRIMTMAIGIFLLMTRPACSTGTETLSTTENLEAAADTEILDMEAATDTEIIIDTEESSNASATNKNTPEILHFVDVFGEEYQVEINPDIEKHCYDLDAFSRSGELLSYTGDAGYTYRLGVDVSHHQGEIDWEKVKSAGFEFAFIRLGYRGYGSAGNICLDKQFYNNMDHATAAGLDVGVYFFSQAVNEAEAREEAEFVLQNLSGYEPDLPVVYDPESILDAEARTDDVTSEQFTKNTLAFCRAIEEAGYQAMIYSNMLWEAYHLDLSQLSGYPIWYADYEPLPQTPYHFEFWQYTNTGTADGIQGDVDLNIQIIK